MKGDIALAGFVLTHEEWQSLDPQSREQLLMAARREEPAPAWAIGTLPGIELPPIDESA